jgi:pullulanase-type alpha-1,6-glucosidase
VRDFTVDPTLTSTATFPSGHAWGTFKGLVDMLPHIQKLGVTHVQLLCPLENYFYDQTRNTQREMTNLTSGANYNWGYDPQNYFTPTGMYSASPDVPAARINELKTLINEIHKQGMGVILDVVYNHTANNFVLADSTLPGYWYRASSTNGAGSNDVQTEHKMVRKLIVDSIKQWVTDYKVDGFRFDLMGHHMKSNLEHWRAALDTLTTARDGVDGPRELMYGEGWDFGEVAGNKRGVNATQKNLAGTGVGTFNDRIRDAVRGGSPFTDRREQGFATGLFTLPGEFNRGGDGDRVKLLDLCDRVRVGLAGNLAGYAFTDRKGNANSGGGLGGTGYTALPGEAVNYVEAHDNETLWDKVMLAAPASATLAQRVRMQLLALSVPAMGQGLPFFHAGGELLRTKSMDADSYDSGDWFNRIDWSMTTNHWGMGLPGAEKNRDRWPLMRPLLARTDLAPGRAEIALCSGAFRDFLRVRKSSPLFRLRTAEDVQARVRFLNTGPAQQPGLIVMTLSDVAAGQPALGSPWKRIVVLFNANPGEVTYRYPVLAQWALALHPAQAGGADPVVKQARFDRAQAAITVPGLTTAVFVGD